MPSRTRSDSGNSRNTAATPQKPIAQMKQTIRVDMTGEKAGGALGCVGRYDAQADHTGGARGMTRISAKPAGEPSGFRGKLKPLDHPHRRANLHSNRTDRACMSEKTLSG